MTKNKNNISFDFFGKNADKSVVLKVAKAFSLIINSSKGRRFSLAMVSSSEIRKWNLIYRGRDSATDVLSFSEMDSDGIIPNVEAGHEYLGEILICSPIVSKQAKLYGWSRNEELARLLAHGLAHLCGYDHENVSKEEERKMIRFEKSILEKAGFIL